MTSHLSSDNATNIERIKSLPNELNDRILKRLNKSIVFADSQFAEWFTLTIGLDTLVKQAGVYNVKEFSALESGGDEHPKAVFFISQPLKGVVIDTLKEIILASRFQFVIVITNLHPELYDESGNELFDRLTDQCLIWMSNPNYTCEVFYERFPFAIFPQHLSSPDNSTLLFLNPFNSWSLNFSDSNLNQLVGIDAYQKLVKQEMSDSGSSGGATISKDHLQQVFQNFGQHELNELKALSYSINEMIDSLDAKVECFTMGVLSTLVANEINSTRKKNNPSNKVSLLLIDRNLDLSVTSLFQEETVFDKINNLLPNSCPYSNDIKIDLRTFLFENKFKSMCDGSFFHFSKDSCRSLIELFFQTKPKECAIEVYRKLCEVCPMSESKDKKASRITSDLLKSQMRSGIKNDTKSIIENIDLIQIISAYCQISDQKSTKHLEFDKIASFVKVMTQNVLNKDGPSVLSRLYGLFSERLDSAEGKSGNYSISDLVVLLIYFYSLVGEDCFYGIEEEDRIKKLLINEFESENFRKDPRFKSDLEFFNKIKKNMNISQFVEKFFYNLKQLKYMRKNMKNYSKLLIRDEEKNNCIYKPLIKQVCENMIKTIRNAPEPLVDIEYQSSNQNEGFNLFKSFKIGYLMNTSTSKPHPLNNDLLIIYVVGGITSYEFKLVREVIREYQPEKNIIVGSSHFCNHTKLMKYLFN